MIELSHVRHYEGVGPSQVKQESEQGRHESIYKYVPAGHIQMPVDNVWSEEHDKQFPWLVQSVQPPPHYVQLVSVKK